MTKNNTYTHDLIRDIKWNEHMRMRPSMYLGQVNLKGFMNLLKGIYSISISEFKSDSLTFEFRNKYEGRIILSNLKEPIVDNWSKWRNKSLNHPFPLEFQPVNALSKHFSIKLSDAHGKEVFHQEYTKGELIFGDVINEPLVGHELEINFRLDDEIWGDDFYWLQGFITHEIREFAYLHKAVKFKVAYDVANEACHILYFFENGLKDRLQIENLKGLGGSYFETYMSTTIEDFYIEMALAFRDYNVDEPFLKSYVNDYYTSEHGSHVDGMLKGLTYVVMKYFQKHNLTQKYKISEKGMRQNLIGMLNIRMQNPVFSGCVKNKLASPEVIEPIANYVAEILFAKIEADDASTQKLIRKFEI